MLNNLVLLGGFCTDAGPILKFISTVFFVFKIVIPILLIVWGSIDLGKAVIAQKEEEIKSATGVLVKRLITAVVIFFLPTIVSLVFGLIGDFQEGTDIKTEYEVCAACIKSPSECPAD